MWNSTLSHRRRRPTTRWLSNLNNNLRRTQEPTSTLLQMLRVPQQATTSLRRQLLLLHQHMRFSTALIKIWLWLAASHKLHFLLYLCLPFLRQPQAQQLHQPLPLSLKPRMTQNCKWTLLE